MKRTIILIAVCLTIAFSFALAIAKDTGEQNSAPPPSISDSTTKPPICEWVCVEWSNDGPCARQEYQCR